MKDKVLLVDDDEIICEIVPEMFDAIDLVAFTAKTMDEAISVFNKHKNEIRMILFDLNLEGVTGVDIFRELLKMNPDFISVLASGSYLDVDTDIPKDVKFNEVIQKPYSLATLMGLKDKYFE